MSIKDGGKISLSININVNIEIEENFSISKINNESKMHVEEDNVKYFIN